LRRENTDEETAIDARPRSKRTGRWEAMAWWIHDRLPYDELEFFPKFAAFSYWLRLHFAPSDQRWKSNVLARVIARMIGHPWLGQKSTWACKA
jgi:hypothetical protein